MHIKPILSAIALTAAISFSGTAFAQTVLNGSEISEADLPSVQERCDQLNEAATNRSAGEGLQNSGDSAGDNNVVSDNPTAVNEVARSTTSSIDLNTITLEACTEAGLITP